jgi:hypothetical protein
VINLFNQIIHIYMKKISALTVVCSLGLAAQAQIIDPLDGTGGISYSTTLVLDNSHGVSGASFTSTGSGLSVNFVGTTSDPEQALFLANTTAFSTTFAVGDILSVLTSVPASGITDDFGLAIAATKTPTAASAGNSWNSRPLTDYAEIALRPSQNAVVGSYSISGAIGSATQIGVSSTANISELYVKWVSADVFTFGYVRGGVSIDDYTSTFAGSSTIGTAIGFYGDIRATGTSIGTFSDLTIAPIPEPSTLALSGLGFAGLLLAARRKNKFKVLAG